MKPIIEIKKISKEYRRNAQRENYLSLRENFLDKFKPSKKKETFLALEDVNFDVYPGDSVAIIGKNGAGKSTLLKILSRITPPSRGEIILRGRLASLLEVGTGFHPELTGRENIYLNGSILGLGRQEINRQFDAIVDFSGVEAFLETPLKHFSSGMQLRLAFAVAAHLEPEILVIDEVLAVGDSTFQQKCITKMTEVSQSGRTLLFVSHNLQAVKNLCQKGVLLKEGKMLYNGNVDSSINLYLEQKQNKYDQVDLQNADRMKSLAEGLKFKRIETNGPILKWGEAIKIRLELSGMRTDDIVVGINIVNQHATTVYHLSNQWLNAPVSFSGNEVYKFEVENNLRPGVYGIDLFLNVGGTIYDWLKSVIQFEVGEGNPYDYSNYSIIQGPVFANFKFETLS